MIRFFLGFLIGTACGAGAFWFFGTPGQQPDLKSAKEEISRSAAHLKDSIKKSVEDLSPESVKEELSKTGTIVREKAKAAGKVIADTATDARITATVKARLTKDLGMAGLHINVDTTDGLVTLSGTAERHDQVAKAVKLALETDGVVKVISTVQVKEEKPPTA